MLEAQKIYANQTTKQKVKYPIIRPKQPEVSKTRATTSTVPPKQQKVAKALQKSEEEYESEEDDADTKSEYESKRENSK